MAQNTRSMMLSLVSHLSERLARASEESDFGSGWSGAVDFLMVSVRETIPAGEKGRKGMTEEEKAEIRARRLPAYRGIVQTLCRLGVKVTAGRILAGVENLTDSEVSFPRSETGIAEDMDALSASGYFAREVSGKGRTFYKA